MLYKFLRHGYQHWSECINYCKRWEASLSFLKGAMVFHLFNYLSRDKVSRGLFVCFHKNLLIHKIILQHEEEKLEWLHEGSRKHNQVLAQMLKKWPIFEVAIHLVLAICSPSKLTLSSFYAFEEQLLTNQDITFRFLVIYFWVLLPIKVV